MPSRRAPYTSLAKPRPQRLPNDPSRVVDPMRPAPVMPDTGSDERRRLYASARWRRLRLQHLKANPLCVMCQAEGIIRAAEICDHRDGHQGDWEARFWDTGGLQSLCLGHHREKSGQEYAVWLNEIEKHQ